MSSGPLDADSPAKLPSGRLTVALAGNPNSGKTTIFNALTGLRQKIANYPGVTVEKKTGRSQLPDGQVIDVIDLPGTYSLISRSPDEHVAMEVLRGLRADTAAPDVVIVVVDASNLQRNLYLVSQLIEIGRPMVVALNMTDVAERRGLNVSPEKLEAALGVPVIGMVGHKRLGIIELKSAVSRARVAPLPVWQLPEAMSEELLLVGGGLAIIDSEDASESTADGAVVDSAGIPSAPRAWICRDVKDRRLDRYRAIAERLLIGDRAADVAAVADREPVAAMLRHANSRLARLGIDPMQADIEAHYRWIDEIAAIATTVSAPASAAALSPRSSDALDATHENAVQAPWLMADRTLDYQPAPTLTDRVDRLLIHKVWGLLIFAGVMGALFVSIFSLADPVMGAVESGVSWVGSLVADRLPEGPIHDLWTDGIVAGVGAVVVFVPQIAVLFLFLSIMEDSGYLARAAFLMDRLLSKVGLHGKSFIPLLSSFACAIPGIMATRTIENRKDRLATIFVAPFMSCSARLPVYTLLIGSFFGGLSALGRGGIMLGLYALGIIAAVATAWVFKRSMLKGRPQTFILELPSYKVPQLSQIVRTVWTNTSEFLKKAGTVIFCLSVVLWALMYYPRLPGMSDGSWRNQWLLQTLSVAHIEGSRLLNEVYIKLDKPVDETLTESKVLATEAKRIADDNALSKDEKLNQLWKLTNPDLKAALERRAETAVAGEQLRQSYAGRFGRLIEPLIKPLGYDWKIGIGLVGSFAAREVFVSTMGIVYSVGDAEEDTTPLEDQMRADVNPSTGQAVWTPVVAASLLVWFVLAMQCMSTLAIVKRETAGWRWPIGMLVYMNGLAYVLSLIVYQIGSRIWH